MLFILIISFSFQSVTGHWFASTINLFVYFYFRKNFLEKDYFWDLIFGSLKFFSANFSNKLVVPLIKSLPVMGLIRRQRKKRSSLGHRYSWLSKSRNVLSVTGKTSCYFLSRLIMRRHFILPPWTSSKQDQNLKIIILFKLAKFR